MQLPNQIINYLTGLFYSFENINSVNLSKFFENLAHDSFTRCLQREEDWSQLLISIVTKLFVLTDGYISLDEVILLKPYSKHIEWLSFVYSKIFNKSFPGFAVIVMCWTNEDFKVPLGFRIWNPATKKFKKKTDIFRDLLKYAKDDLSLWPKAVLFDSYFSDTKTLKMLNKWGWIFCTQIKKNRLFNRKRIDKFSFRPYWTATGYLKGGIKVRVARHGRKYFCTNDLSLGHSAIRTLYKKRWPIEEIFRFTKQKLGLQECQSRSIKAQTAHFTMCMIAYVILQKESTIRKVTDYKIKSELSFQRANFNLHALNLLIS